MTLKRLLAELGHRELDLWLAKEMIEPSGERRADLRAGLVASTLVNLNRDRDLRPEPFISSDMIASYPLEPAAPPSEEELAAKIDGIFAARIRK